MSAGFNGNFFTSLPWSPDLRPSVYRLPLVVISAVHFTSNRRSRRTDQEPLVYHHFLETASSCYISSAVNGVTQKDSVAEFARLARLTCRLKFPRGKPNNFVPGISLNGPQVSADCREIALELQRMLHSILSYFLNNRVFHLSTSNSSSGEQISGHWEARGRGQRRARGTFFTGFTC